MAAPTATILIDDADSLIGSAPTTVTITFSEAVTGVALDGFTYANGLLTNLHTDDDIVFTATFTPDLELGAGTNVISFNMGTVMGPWPDLESGAGTIATDNFAIDTVAPTVTIAMGDSALKIGDSPTTVTFTFSERVANFTNSDLDLTLANGTLSTVGSSDFGLTYTAQFTPTAGATQAVNVITVAAGGVTDSAGNAVAATSSPNFTIDLVRPAATTIEVADTALAIGETSNVTITFSEAVSNFTTADMTPANGSLSGLSSADGGITWTATLTPSASITDTTNLITLDNTGVTDGAGNAGSGTTDSNNYAIDTVRPTATIFVADAALQPGDTSNVTIIFSEAITSFSNADLLVSGGTLSNVATDDGGTTWTATLSTAGAVPNTPYVITLANSGVTDQAGNTGAGTTPSNAYVIDTVAPTVTSIVLADPALKAGETSLVTFTFSEAVTDFENADLEFGNGTLTNVVDSGDGITWTATFTPDEDITETANIFTLAGADVTDLAGNAGSGTRDSANYTIDTERPTVTSIVLANPALKAGETSLVTFTFSEAVTDFEKADLEFGNGTLTNVVDSGDGITWIATFTPDQDVTETANIFTLAGADVTDLAGNAGSGTRDSANYAVDTARPTATTITFDDDALKAGGTAAVTITFSEAVTGFTEDDLTVANGSLANLASGDGGVTWTGTFTPGEDITDTTNLITLDNTGVTDGAGNAGSGTTDSDNYTVETVRPTATIVVADTTLTVGETSLVTITFSEAVSGFDNTDLAVANGTLTNVTSSDGGITFTAILTPTAALYDTSNVITLANTGVMNVFGNSGLSTTNSNNYAVETGPGPGPQPNTPTAGDDVITLPATGGTISAGEGADTVIGGADNDIINGNVGDDSVSGGGGDDIVRGGQGADFVQGNTGDDLIFGDIGEDTVHGGQGGDFVQGNAGSDIVSGDLGNDTVLGGQGHDIVLGGAGDDYVSGDLGNDILVGGTGADLFNFSGGGGHDMVTDFSRAEGDHIRISPSDAANFSALSSHITSQGADTLITLGAQTVILVGVSASSLTAADFVFG